MNERFEVTEDTIHDKRTGLTWSRTLGNKTVTDKKADKLVAECRAGGFADWRKPTVEELFLLADRTRYSPAIDTEAFPDCKSDWYWSSSPDASDPTDYAWIVHFYDGYSGGLGRSLYAWVRAVRGPASQ